jgi:hypothetical protein
MDINFFFPETVSIEHVNGTVSSGVRAQIEKSSEIILLGNQIVVSVDDVIVHTLENGAVHRYSVQNASYNRGFAHMPAITTLKVQKHGAKDSRAVGGHHVYNVSGNNARINVHSTDRSTNVVSAPVNPVFDDLRAALDALPHDHPQKSEMMDMADVLSTTPTNTKTFTERFQQFMALAANCMTVVGPFVPELAKLLGHQ